jgi:hypothetical protein
MSRAAEDMARDLRMNSLIRQISEIVPGSTKRELDREGKARKLRTETHTMDARNLCPEQGTRAARGFLNVLRHQ